MYATKLILAMVLLVGTSARHVPWEVASYGFDEQDLEHLGQDFAYPGHLLSTGSGYPEHLDQDYEEDFEYQHPGHLASARVRRQAQGSLTLNSDGTTGLGIKVPIVGNDKNSLSALGSVGLDNHMNTASRGFGLALDNVNGHGLSVMKETLPGLGSKLTGAGHATLFNNDVHKVGANAFVSRTMPTKFPGVPNFNTVGGGVDYTFKNKIGASLGMAHTPFLERKDYSAMGNLNLFRNPTTSVDFSAGYKKFETPFMNSGWKPNFGLTFGRSF